jgi:hypothetical protein
MRRYPGFFALAHLSFIRTATTTHMIEVSEQLNRFRHTFILRSKSASGFFLHQATISFSSSGVSARSFLAFFKSIQNLLIALKGVAALPAAGVVRVVWSTTLTVDAWTKKNFTGNAATRTKEREGIRVESRFLRSWFQRFLCGRCLYGSTNKLPNIL